MHRAPCIASIWEKKIDVGITIYIYFWLFFSAVIDINFPNIVVINIPAVIVHAAHTHDESGCLFRLSYL